MNAAKGGGMGKRSAAVEWNWIWISDDGIGSFGGLGTKKKW
jgi:hypothetical protein